MPATQEQISALGQFRTKPIGPDNLFVWAWTQFFQKLETFRQNAPTPFFKPQAALATTSPTKVGIGSFFYATDTKNYYVSDGTVWHQLGTAIS